MARVISFVGEACNTVATHVEGDFHIYGMGKHASHRVQLECKPKTGRTFRLELTKDEAVKLFALAMGKGVENLNLSPIVDVHLEARAS